MVPKFAIIYHDRVVEGGGAGDEYVDVVFRVSKAWIDAPVDGVQAVIIEDPYQGRSVVHGVDHYYMLPEGGLVHGADDIGPYMRGHLRGIVKYGLCVSHEDNERWVKYIRQYDRIKPFPNEKRRPRPNDVVE